MLPYKINFYGPGLHLGILLLSFVLLRPASLTVRLIMAVRALLLAVLLIEINSSIQVDDSDIARETAISSSKNPGKLQKQFSYNITRLLRNMSLVRSLVL